MGVMVWKRRYVYYYIHIYNYIYICIIVRNSPTKVRRAVEGPTVLPSRFYYLLYEVGQLELIDTSVDTRETTPRHRGARRKDFERVRPVI